jgi:hypothetical protein
MKHFLLVFFSLFIFFNFQNVASQNNNVWKGYFSYNDIRDLSEGTNTVFAAAQNALFTQNTASGEIKTLNTIDGLPGEYITTMHHSISLNKTIFGYENGLIIVRNDIDGSVVYVVDIISKSIPTNVKKINHFMEFEGLVYISCDFGIVQYNLNNLVFGDTYNIGNGGSFLKINQTAIFEGKIYAATASGIRSALVANPNLIDFSQWTTLDGSNWLGIERFGDKLMAVTNSGNIQKLVGAVFISQTIIPQIPEDFRSSGEYLIATTQNNIFVYNSNLAQLTNITSNQIPETIALKFSCATVIDSKIYIGTKENGLYSTAITGGLNFESLSPNGPSRNNVFNLKKASSSLWAVFGGYNNYNPYDYDNLSQHGISKLTDNQWKTIPFSAVLGARALSRITVNPDNENQVYISSFFSGLLKLENDVPTILYNATNTGPNGLRSLILSTPNPNYVDIRVGGTAFDKNKKLWMGTGLVNPPLNSLSTNGTWQVYDLQNKITTPQFNYYSSVVVDKNNTKWFATFQGLIAFNEENNKLLVVKDNDANGGSRLNDIKAVAIDNRNQIWLGTGEGLRVVSSVDSFLTNDEVTSDAIIIEEEGLAQELLYQQTINDIVVDGANNKWIATSNSGVFQFSPNGQKTLQRFTTKNSPLPSNRINDIEIDSVTGEVFFATDKGMISYKGSATSAKDNLDNVYIFPNPVRPEFEGTVKISGLLDKATIKITDISGNLVHEATSEGGTIEWDTTAFGKYKVASGVYMVFISAANGEETKTKKVMIVR